jgi:hypothetical protein
VARHGSFKKATEKQPPTRVKQRGPSKAPAQARTARTQPLKTLRPPRSTKTPSLRKVRDIRSDKRPARGRLHRGFRGPPSSKATSEEDLTEDESVRSSGKTRAASRRQRRQRLEEHIRQDKASSSDAASQPQSPLLEGAAGLTHTPPPLLDTEVPVSRDPVPTTVAAKESLSADAPGISMGTEPDEGGEKEMTIAEKAVVEVRRRAKNRKRNARRKGKKYARSAAKAPVAHQTESASKGGRAGGTAHRTRPRTRPVPEEETPAQQPSDTTVATEQRREGEVGVFINMILPCRSLDQSSVSNGSDSHQSLNSSQQSEASDEDPVWHSDSKTCSCNNCTDPQQPPPGDHML